jgi:hypothetical protein
MMRRVAIVVTAFFAMTLITVSCKQSTGPSPVSASYPFAAGNSWTYLITDSMTNIKILRPGWNRQDTVVHSVATVTCQGKVVLRDSLTAWCLRTVYNNQQYTADHYYTFPGDTMKCVAYAGSEIMTLPKHNPEVRFQCGGRTFSSLAELKRTLIPDDPGFAPSPAGEIVYETDPPVALIYPLAIGRNWDYRTGSNGIVQIHKTIIETGTVRVPAGTFEASVIRWQWRWTFGGDPGWDSTMTGYECVSHQGLLKREFLIRNFAVTDEESNVFATMDFIHQSVASSLPSFIF